MGSYAYDLKQRQTQKEHEFKLLMDALDASSDMIAVVTGNKCVYRNRALIEATGITAEIVNEHGGPAWNKMTPGDFENFMHIVDARGIFDANERIRSLKDPEGMLVHVHAVRLNDSDIIKVYHKL